jgi:putative endonuclease
VRIGWRARQPRNPRQLGAAGERLARRRLRADRYRILARNLRTRTGELDIVALAPDGSTVVFVEVKTRVIRDDRQTPPPESQITAHKRRKLLQLAQRVASQQGWSDRPLRIDVIAIDWPTDGRPDVRHYVNAVTR